MVRSSYERALEKQIKETRKQAEEAKLRDHVNAIISGQPVVNGLRILDSNSEEMLDIILSLYDGNNNNYVEGTFDAFPEYISRSISFEFEKLKMYGMVNSSTIFMSGIWSVYLTSQAKSYFKNKNNFDNQPLEITMNLPKRKEYDVFISHANKDKLTYVEQLYITLRKLGIKIFYDSEDLSWGDNWKQVILDSTAKSEFAIIVISNEFFGREWTERELNEFLQRQNESGQKIILPLLYNLTFEDLKLHYPELEVIQSIKTSDKTVDDIAILLAKELIKRYR